MKRVEPVPRQQKPLANRLKGRCPVYASWRVACRANTSYWRRSRARCCVGGWCQGKQWSRSKKHMPLPRQAVSISFSVWLWARDRRSHPECKCGCRTAVLAVWSRSVPIRIAPVSDCVVRARADDDRGLVAGHIWN